MKLPKIKSKKASELIKSILKKNSPIYSSRNSGEKKPKTFYWENITPNNSSLV